MKNKTNITDILFICIMLNLLPIMLLGVLDVPYNIYTIANLIVFMIQTTVVVMTVRKKICEIRKNERDFLIVFAFLQIVIQVINFIVFKSILIKDFANSVSVLINIFLFIFMCSKFEIDKETFLLFMKKLVTCGIIALAIGMILNIKELINIFITQDSYNGGFQSIFPNKNQFGLFLLIMNISNLYLVVNNKKKKDIVIQVLFAIGVVLTMSRNCMIGMLLFYLLVLTFNFKQIRAKLPEKKKKVILLATLSAITLCIIIIVVFPSIRQTIDKLFIRSYTINPNSGRIKVWENGIKIFLLNPVMGLGRYRSLTINKNVFGSTLTHFHSIYIEMLASYGLIGFICLIYLLYYIIKRIKNSGIDLKDKNILLAGLITFLVVSCFESICRFSIGYVDTMSLIYFITLPIMYANKVRDKEEKNEKR